MRILVFKSYLILLLVSLTFINCSGPGVSGATSETTNGQVSSVAINENGFAVTNASVFIYKKDALREINDSDLVPITKTDNSGKFAIYNLDSIDYNLEIVDSVGNRAMVSVSFDSVAGEHSIQGIEQIALRAPGRLFGTVEHNPYEKVLVQVYGLHRVVEADSAGYFVFADLPKGDITIKISTDTGLVVAEQDSFGIKSSESTNCGNYSTGSSLEIEYAIIRNFLDLNNLVDVDVDDVAEGSSRHYYGLYCDTFGIDTVTPDLSKLRLKELSLAYNEIIHIPEEICNLATLTYLDISGNHLTHLPESIGFLESLQKLDVGENDLIELPESILNLEHIEELYINYNKLQHLPPHIRTWIDEYSMDGYWEETQR